MRINAPFIVWFHHRESYFMAIPQDDGGADGATDGWDFDLSERVTLLWSGAEGSVVGRTEFIHQDVQYLIEYVDTAGRLTRQWVYEDGIDHLPVRH